MRDRQHASTPAPIDPSELAAILDEVRRAVLAVDAGTGEFRPLADLTLTPPETTDTVAER